MEALWRRTFRPRLLAWALVFPLAAPAAADTGAAAVGDAFFDVLLLRTTGLMRTVAGCASLVVVWPLSLPAGNGRDSYETMCEDPGKFTFTRTLGDF